MGETTGMTAHGRIADARSRSFAGVYSSDIRRIRTVASQLLKRLVRPRGIEPRFAPVRGRIGWEEGKETAVGGMLAKAAPSADPVPTSVAAKRC